MANDIEIHGFCEDRFEPVKQVFAEHFKSGLEVGSSFAAAIIEEQSYGRDLTMRRRIRFGLGWGLTCEENPIGANPRAFYWGGLGGSQLIMDLDAKLSAAYAMNKMFFSFKGKPRAKKLIASL